MSDSSSDPCSDSDSDLDYPILRKSQSPENRVAIPGDEILLKELFDTHLFSDLKLKVGSEIYPVHKAVLFFNSPFFKNLLTTETSDRYKEEIELIDVDVEGFKLVLNYIYSGKIDLTSENVYNVISVANYFQMDSLKNKCSEVLLKVISRTTAVDVFQAAFLYDIEKLKIYAKDKIIEDDISEKITGFSYSCMQCFVKTTCQTCYGIIKSNEFVFATLQLWIKYDVENRQK